MAESTSIRPADLLIDENNPRLPQPNVGQKEALRALARHQARKMLVLARDIAQRGLDPSALPIVMSAKDDLIRYVVLEGNRRLVALRALENPETFMSAVDDATLTELRKLSKEYLAEPIDSVECLLVKDRDEAHHWIQLRHTGENGGVGVVPWGSEDQTRYKARSGNLPLHSQALNFLEAEGRITQDQRRAIPVTNLKRLLDTPEVQEKVGIDLRAGQMVLLGNPDQVARALLYVAKNLPKVGQIYTKVQRVAYANSIPQSVVVHPDGKGSKKSDDGGSSGPKRAKPKKQKPREYLIPRDCVLAVTDRRCHEIESELRTLNFIKYPNAVAVLFRVFTELSVDVYITTRSLALGPDETLRAKLQVVVTDLVARTKLVHKTATPVRKAMQKGSWLLPSIDLMHDYVHNENAFPAPGDLRASWNGLQPFFVALWSA